MYVVPCSAFTHVHVLETTQPYFPQSFHFRLLMKCTCPSNCLDGHPTIRTLQGRRCTTGLQYNFTVEWLRREDSSLLSIILEDSRSTHVSMVLSNDAMFKMNLLVRFKRGRTVARPTPKGILLI